MDKKYLLSNGSTQIVPLEYEQQFFKLLDEANLTAELITDEPGKSLGTSQSQNNQLKIDEDVSIDLTTGEVISKIIPKDTASKSDDGSLGSQSGKQEDHPLGQDFGGTELSVVNQILSEDVKDEDQRQRFYTLFANRLSNIKPRAKKAFKGFYADMLNMYKNVDFGAIATGASRTDEEREEEIKELDDKIIKQIKEVKELEFEDEGLGIVGGIKEGSGADVLAAALFTPIQLMETMVPAVLTRGASLIPQMGGPMYYDFNEQKAIRLYGEDDPEAMEKLVRNNETEVLKPLIATVGAVALERLGLKAVDDYIRGVPGLIGSFSRLTTASTYEAATEIGQHAIENVNMSLGQGDDLQTATAKGIKSMFTDEGLESFIQGFIGGGTVSASGRAINRALRSDKNANIKINEYIDNLSELNTQRIIAQDKDVKDALDLQIKQTQRDFKKFIIDTRAVSQYLTEDEKKSLIKTINEKDNIQNKITSLDNKIKNRKITQESYDLAIKSLNSRNDILDGNVLSIKKQVLESAAKRTTESVKKQITDMGLEGKVTEMTSEEISKLDEKGLDSKSAAQSFGFIKQQPDGSFEIILNKDKPMEGTAAHEFMHAVLFKTLAGSEQTQNNLASALLDYTSTLKSKGDKNFVNRINAYKDSKALGEEVITVMSESIMDGSLKYNDGFFTKVGDILRRFFAQRGKVDYEFNTGRDVYNFIKDYNNSIKTGKVNKAIIKVAKEGAKGKLVDKAKKDVDTKQDVVLKESRDAKPDVDNLAVDQKTGKNYTQQEWDKTGAKRAIDTLEERGLIDGLIASKYKVRPVPQSFVADVLGSGEFINMINRFNRNKRGKSDENKSLFGYIQGQLRFRADDVFKANERGKVPKGTKVRELDARTTEGQPKTQLEDTGDTTIQRIDEQEINLRDDKVQDSKPEVRERKSKFRNEIGITRKGRIFREVKKALRTAESIVNPKKFLNTFEKTVSDALFNFMKVYFPDTNSMIKYRAAILESIPVTTLVQMQKQLTEKIFVKSYGRLTNKTQLSDFVYGRNESGKNPGKKKLLTKDILDDSEISKVKRKAGVQVYERLKPTSTQWQNYLNATEKGKRQTAQKSGTKGNNRIKILEESAKAIGRDATPENLTTDFLEDYIQEKGLQNVLTVEQVKKEILKSIDRPADLKFSVDPKVQAENFKTAANKNPNNIVSDRGVTNLEVVNKIQKYKSAKSGKIRSRTIVDFIKSSKLSKDIKKHMGGFLSTHPKYIPYFQDSMTGGYDNGLFGVKDVFYNVVGVKDTNIKRDLRREKYSKIGSLLDVNKMNKFKNNQGKHVASNKARIDFLEGLIKDMYTYVKANPESKPAIVMFFKDGSKHQNHVLRYLAPIVGAPVNAKGKFLEVKIKEEHGYPQNQVNTIILDLLLNDNTSIKSIDDAVKVFKSSYSQWALIESHDNQIDDAKLTASMPEYFYNDIVPRILNGDLDSMPQGIVGPIIRYIESGVPVGGYYLFEVNQTVAEYFGVNVENASEIDMQHLAPIQNELIKQILLGNIDIKTAKQKMKDVAAIGHNNTIAENKTANNIIDAFNKQAETIKKQNKELQADLEKRGYTFKSSKDGGVKGQTPSQMIKIIEEDLKKRGYTFISNQGMSTFDFDETLIIDGENFVVATDPKTGETINIKSGEWPIKGPELDAAGYKFNFDDFVNVRGGVEGPLLQKMRNQIDKYGVNNVFVLTARPQTADSAIHGWLKSKGINIPMKNITGLGNSTGEAKANWMLEKFTEGYNDMYFVDDALPNVNAVKKVLEQLDVKSKVVQAKIKFSATASHEFNNIIEQVKGVHKDRIYSAAEALKLGINKGRYDLLIPPSANDFKGLMYYFMGKGKQGEAHKAWFEKHLFKPFAKGIKAWNTYKQNLQNEYETLKRKHPGVIKKLNNKVSGTAYTNDSAIRVYLWEEAGFQIPGLSLIEQKKLSNHVRNNPDLRNFAETLRVISKIKDGYAEPGPNWVLQTIASDLNNIVERIGRKQFLAEYLANAEAIFSQENLNKIEAVYGTRYREALEDILHRMETGSNRIQGSSRIVNGFTEWINASVGAIMFVNMRSALLQTISMVNFINWSDNNVFKAGAAFANQPQFWKDFAMIYNSDQLKQRRKGIRIDVSASELTKTFAEGGTTMLDKTQALLRYLLEKGFTPTQLADSFAIAMGGAPFYRNRFNTYKKQGLSDAKAREKAMLDFQEIAEETQQSSREDLISQQQASPLGRFILAFQNVTMQMTRLTVKAVSDLVNRRGDWKTNVSKIIYYGAVQNIIFGSLQSALAFIMWGDDEEEDVIKDKTARVANGVLDSFLRGTGIYGAMVSTLKNVALQTQAQYNAKYGKSDFSKVAIDAINLSPPIGSKVRKIVSAAKTISYNKGISKEIGVRIENPTLVAVATAIEAITNIPLGRLVNKANNVEEAVTGNHKLWQRVALLLGWDKWTLGVKDEELEQAKLDAKETRNNRRKKEKQVQDKKEEQEKKRKGIKTVRCSGTNSAGKRCGLTTETTDKTWKCFHHATFKDGMDRDGDGIKEYRCTGKKVDGNRCKNKTENKNKRCYAHQ